MCAYAVRVAVGKIAGVDSVRVSLNEGLAVVWLHEQNTVTVEQIREAIRSNGFTPKAAKVRATGRLLENGGRLVLAFAGTPALLLREHPSAPALLDDLRQALGAYVAVEGETLETQRGDARLPDLAVREFARLAR
ncbi:MAG TPA: heavy-metal-associated domain-containing protein [Gemmatimonadales bacterium]